jgi:Ca2+-binding EF-hand superfamily protein
VADDDGSGQLSLGEFTKAVRDFGLDLDPLDVQGLFKSMDLDMSGFISFNEFLRVVAGEMNPFRRSLVERAFRTLDSNKDSEIDVKELLSKYSPNQHPEVRQGKKTPEQAALQFMETFEKHHELILEDKVRAGKDVGDGKVTLEEFVEYYNNISCSIDNDSYFDLMISNAWQLDGSSNPAAMPYAGTAKKVAYVNSRDEYRRDHHRNLFGTD